MVHRIIFTSIKRILLLQCILAGLAAAVILGVSNLKTSLSALIGGSCVVVPAAIYANIAYVKRYVVPAKLMRAHYLAEALKFVTTLIMMVIVFIGFDNVSITGLSAGFLAALSAYWFGLLIK